MRKTTVEQIKELNENIFTLDKILKDLGYKFEVGSGRNNKKKIYIYSKDVILNKRNSTKKAVLVSEFYYRYKNFFLSELQTLKNEHEQLDAMSKQLFIRSILNK